MAVHEAMCEQCGHTYLRASRNRRFCDDCRHGRHLAASRKYEKQNPEKVAAAKRKATANVSPEVRRLEARASYWRNKPARLEYHLMRKYKLTLSAYNEMLEAQNGCCAICGDAEFSHGRRLDVDHDHGCCPGEISCGKCIRGLLCLDCNTAIGKLKDDLTLLRKAAEYIAAREVF